MEKRDNKGNTEQEVHDLFFNWLDNLSEVVHPFSELPELQYSDLVAYCGWTDEDENCYGDIMFDLWYRNVYNQRKY